MQVKNQPNIVLLNFTRQIRPIGCQNVYTYIQSKGFQNTFLIHIFFEFGADSIRLSQQNNLMELLQKLNPDIIGFSLMGTAFKAAKSLSSVIKNALPDVIRVWGGIHATLVPEECSNFCEIICRGEGEEPFYELICSLVSGGDISKIANLWICKNGEIIKNELRPYGQDLDTRPYSQINWDKTYLLDKGGFKTLTKRLLYKYDSMQGTFYGIMASRGCPYSCSYCANCILNQIQKGKILRFRSVGHIMSELKYVKEKFSRVVGINFEDDAFGAASVDYFRNFANRYKKEVALPFHIRIIPSMINERKIEILKDAGLASAVLGLQGSDRLNKTIFQRNSNKERFLEIAQILRKYDIAGRYDVITQNPYSTEDDEIEVIQTLIKTPKPYHLIEFPLAFIPKTKLAERAIKDGVLSDESTYYDSPTGYGAGKNEKFPILAMIRIMTPYSPTKFIRFFLEIHKKGMGKFLIMLYYVIVYKPEEKIISFIIRDYKITYFVQKVLMLMTRKK